MEPNLAGGRGPWVWPNGTRGATKLLLPALLWALKLKGDAVSASGTAANRLLANAERLGFQRSLTLPNLTHLTHELESGRYAGCISRDVNGKRTFRISLLLADDEMPPCPFELPPPEEFYPLAVLADALGVEEDEAAGMAERDEVAWQLVDGVVCVHVSEFERIGNELMAAMGSPGRELQGVEPPDAAPEAPPALPPGPLEGPEVPEVDDGASAVEAPQERPSSGVLLDILRTIQSLSIDAVLSAARLAGTEVADADAEDATRAQLAAVAMRLSDVLEENDRLRRKLRAAEDKAREDGAAGEVSRLRREVAALTAEKAEHLATIAANQRNINALLDGAAVNDAGFRALRAQMQERPRAKAS